jgi:Flp pilus assembly pilin Flp
MECRVLQVLLCGVSLAESLKALDIENELIMVLRLLRDESGFLVSSELVLVATIVVIGLISGMTTLRDQVLQELADVADAVSEVNQSYSYSGITGHSSSVSGSVFADLEDYCENALGASDQFGAGSVDCTQGVVPTITGLAE